jgi:putative endonuclease
MAQHNDLGKLGEQLAARYLVDKGYEILDENWCHGKAEIDLIAYINKQIIFVEVKTRSSVAFGYPEEFVGDTKQRLMQFAAEEYIELMNHQGEVRFDIISIVFLNENHTLNHIEDAFWPYQTP